MIVGIDIGNSAIKLIRESSPDAVDVFPLAMESWPEQTVSALSEISPAMDVPCRIASVNRVALRLLLAAASSHFGDDIRFHVIVHTDVPIKKQIDAPEKVGIDRLLSAFAATRRHRGPLVIVDAGSAITVDWVDESGVYCGGAILPGMRMQASALAAGTDGLPQWVGSLTADNLSPESLIPGRNTMTAIRLGVSAATLGGIEKLATSYAQSAGVKPTLVVTGGDGAGLARRLGDAVYESQLVCRGLLEL